MQWEMKWSPIFELNPFAKLFDRQSMLNFLKQNKGTLFWQMGSTLYSLAGALKEQAEGNSTVLLKTLQKETFEAVFFTGMPLLAEYLEFKYLLGTLNYYGFFLSALDLGFQGYQNFMEHLIEDIWVEPFWSARLAGVWPNGSRTHSPDILTALGAPSNKQDFEIHFDSSP